MWEILIDEHRSIYGVVFVASTLTDAEKAAKRSRLSHARTQLSGAGHRASVVSVSTFPTGFAIGRVLSADGSAAAVPAADHAPSRRRERRRMVEAWALRETGHGFMLLAMNELYRSRDYPPPADDQTGDPATPLGEVWKALVLLTLAASRRDAWLDDRNVWPGIQKNISVTADSFLSRASPDRWREHYADMESMAGFFWTPVPIVATLGPNRIPAAVASAADLRAGRDEARAILFGDRR